MTKHPLIHKTLLHREFVLKQGCHSNPFLTRVIVLVFYSVLPRRSLSFISEPAPKSLLLSFLHSNGA